MDKWSWDEDTMIVTFKSEDFKVSDAMLEAEKEPQKSAEEEEKLNAILPVGVGSTLWQHFGFPINWCDFVWSRKKVICRLCKKPLVVKTDIALKMKLHLHQSHPEVDVQSEHMAAITQIPSYKFATEEEAEEFDEDEEEEEEPTESDDGDEDYEDIDDDEEETKPFKKMRAALKFMFEGVMPFGGLSEDKDYSNMRFRHAESKAKFRLEELLGPSGQCSLSLEVWSRGCGEDDFLTVSINYINLNDAFRLENKVLFTKKMMDLDDDFMSLLKEWGLKKEQIVAAVCSMEIKWTGLLDRGQLADLPVVFCFLSFLDKLVQEELFGLPEVDWMIRRCYLEKNGWASIYVHTNWNDYIFKLRDRLTCPEDYELNKEQVFLLKQLMVVLEYLNVALAAYREEYPFGHLSILAPILNKMLDHFQPCEQDNPILSKMKQTVVEYTKSTYHKVMPFLFEATRLDPRFRGELNPNIDQTQKAVCEKEKEMQRQLDKFSAGAPTDFLVSSVVWWETKEAYEEFPLLLPLVRKFHCVPASCIPHPRVQSDTFAYKRHEIKEEFVDSYLFIKSEDNLFE